MGLPSSVALNDFRSIVGDLSFAYRRVGSITNEGVYTAGATGGLHSVRATAGDREAIAEVRVRIDQPQPEDDGDDDKPVVKPGKQTLRWRGTVPPQKWMNFYTKVLTRFASSPELKLEVSIEVPIDREQAQSKADETKSGLKELGLDDNAARRVLLRRVFLSGSLSSMLRT